MTSPYCLFSLQRRHNGRDSVSNHQRHDCLLNRLFRRRSKKISKLRVTGLCAGNSPVTSEFPAKMASNAENISIWWRHHIFRMPVSVSGIHVNCKGKASVEWEANAGGTAQHPHHNHLHNHEVYIDLSTAVIQNRELIATHQGTKELGKIFTGAKHMLLWVLRSCQMFTGLLFHIKLLSSVLLKGFQSFKIYQLRQYLVNFMGLAGVVHATVYKTEQIFTGLGHGKLFYFLTLHTYPLLHILGSFTNMD